MIPRDAPTPKARRALALALAAFAAITMVSVRAASAGTDRIAIEAYEGDRPVDADAVLAPVYGELATRGYVQGWKLAPEVRDHVSRDAGALTAGQIVDAQRQVGDAYQKLIDGDYASALDGARAALAFYDAAPGQLAREPALRDQRYKALAVAARSSEVKGSATDAFELMAELIRSFPDRPVTSAQFDPKVSALYQRVKGALERRGTGSLEIKVDDPDAAVFVDEQLAGSGGAMLTKLTPGRYRIFVSKGKRPGRVHDVDVSPGSAGALTISWALDGALRTSGAVVALDVDKNNGRDAEVLAATQLARALGARAVIVLAVRRIHGRRAIAGYSISVESETRAFAAVQIEPLSPTGQTLSQLAALLDGDKHVTATGLITTEPARGDNTSDVGMSSLGRSSSSEGDHWYASRLGWVFVGAGVLALVGGAVAETRASSLDDQAATQSSQADRMRTLDDASSYRTTGDVLLITGGVAAAAGIVTFVLSSSQSSSRVERSTVSLDVGPSWLGVRGSF